MQFLEKLKNYTRKKYAFKFFSLIVSLKIKDYSSNYLFIALSLFPLRFRAKLFSSLFE